MNTQAYKALKSKLLELNETYSGQDPNHFKDRVLYTYYQWAIKKLMPLFKSDSPTQDLAQNFESFFKENWALVKGTMVSPTSIPESDLTLFLCDLASEIAPDLKLNPVEVLCRDVFTESVFKREIYQNLDANISLKDIIKTHILSEDARTLIPIAYLNEENYINGSYEAGTERAMNPYFYNQEAEPGQDVQILTHDEFKRLAAHSKHSEELKSAIEHRQRLAQDKSDLGSQLTALITRLRIEDAHGGRGSQEKVGEGAFTSLVEFGEFYAKLKDKKSLIPRQLREAIDKLIEVGSPEEDEKKSGKSMVDRIETCAGTRREQIEKAMPADKSILAQISLGSDLVQAEKVKAEQAITQTRGSLIKLLTPDDQGRINYEGGADTLSFNQHLLETLKVRPQVNNIEDLALIANLNPKELALVLENNTTLQDQIVTAIDKLENLVMQTHLMSPDKLEVFLKILAPEIKARGIVNENLDADIKALLITHAENSEAYKLLLLYFHNSPLAFAIKNNQLDLAKCLIEEKGADVNVKDSNGNTPLLWACYIGHLEFAKYLIEEKGADVNVKNKYGYTPLSLACNNGHLEVAKYLIEEKGTDVNVNNNDGSTPLMWACWKGHLELAKYLIEEKGADVNVKNKYGSTPLMQACDKGHLELAKYLIEEKGADVNVKNNDGFTPLMRACENSHLEFAKYLIEEKGADVNVRDSNGDTLLMWACEKGHLDLAKLLAEKGAYVNVLGSNGDTPFTWACKKGNLEFAKFLQTASLKYWVKVPNAPYPVPQNYTREYKKDLSDMRDNPKLYIQQLKDTDIKKLLCGNAEENAFLQQCNFYPLLKDLLIKRALLELDCLSGGQLKPRLNALSVLTCRLVAAQEKLISSQLPPDVAQQQFTKECAEAIKDARPELSKHRSTAGLILKCIVSLLILPVFIYAGLIKGTLFKTDTENKIDRLASKLGLFKTNAPDANGQKEGERQEPPAP